MRLRTLLLLALVVPTSLAAQRDGDRLDTTFVLQKGGSVHLGLVSGEIRVVGTERPDVRIVADIERGAFEQLTSATRVSITTRSVNGRQGSARYDVQVPIGTRVSATTISGNVDIRDTKGEVTVRTTSGRIDVRNALDRVEANSISGDIELRGVRGRIRIESTSGGTRIEEAAGELATESVSGSIAIRRSTLSEVRAEATSGSIQFEGALAASGNYRFNTHSGSVTLSLPADVGASLELETFSGRISTDFPLVLQPGERMGRRDRQMEFTLGSGGARVIVGAFSGSITIRRRVSAGTGE